MIACIAGWDLLLLGVSLPVVVTGRMHRAHHKEAAVNDVIGKSLGHKDVINGTARIMRRVQILGAAVLVGAEVVRALHSRRAECLRRLH